LMFCSGFEIQRKFEKRDEKVILALVIGTTVVPLFLVGFRLTFLT